MKLLTKEIERRIPRTLSQENKYSENPDFDPTVHVKFFCPWNTWTWYGIEYDPENREFFGLVVGFEVELGYFALAEMEEVTGPFMLKIERDRGFSATPLSEIRAQIKDRHPDFRFNC